MNQTNNQLKRLEAPLLEALDIYRGQVMDIAELQMGTQGNWKSVRGHLLKCLGDRGLAGRISEILSAEFEQGSVAK